MAKVLCNQPLLESLNTTTKKVLTEYRNTKNITTITKYYCWVIDCFGFMF